MGTSIFEQYHFDGPRQDHPIDIVRELADVQTVAPENVTLAVMRSMNLSSSITTADDAQALYIKGLRYGSVMDRTDFVAVETDCGSRDYQAINTTFADFNATSRHLLNGETKVLDYEDRAEMVLLVGIFHGIYFKRAERRGDTTSWVEMYPILLKQDTSGIPIDDPLDDPRQRAVSSVRHSAQLNFQKDVQTVRQLIELSLDVGKDGYMHQIGVALSYGRSLAAVALRELGFMVTMGTIDNKRPSATPLRELERLLRTTKGGLDTKVAMEYIDADAMMQAMITSADYTSRFMPVQRSTQAKIAMACLAGFKNTLPAEKQKLFNELRTQYEKGTLGYNVQLAIRLAS